MGLYWLKKIWSLKDLANFLGLDRAVCLICGWRNDPDIKLLELARGEAISVFKEDPDLKMTKNNLLAMELARVWPGVHEWS